MAFADQQKPSTTLDNNHRLYELPEAHHDDVREFYEECSTTASLG